MPDKQWIEQQRKLAEGELKKGNYEGAIEKLNNAYHASLGIFDPKLAGECQEDQARVYLRRGGPNDFTSARHLLGDKIEKIFTEVADDVSKKGEHEKSAYIFRQINDGKNEAREWLLHGEFNSAYAALAGKREDYVKICLELGKRAQNAGEADKFYAEAAGRAKYLDENERLDVAKLLINAGKKKEANEVLVGEAKEPFSSQNFERAINLFRKVGNEKKAIEMEAERALSDGDEERAVQLFERAGKQLRAKTLHIKIAQDSEANQRFGEAANHYNLAGNEGRAKEMWEREANADLELAAGETGLRRRNHLIEAARNFDRAGNSARAATARADAERPELWVQIAREREAAGDYSEAAEAWEKAGNFEEAARAWMRSGNKIRAVENWTKAAKNFEEDGNWVEAARVWKEAGNEQMAKQAAGRAFEEGNYEKALRAWVAAGGNEDEFKKLWDKGVAEKAFADGNYEQAAKAWETSGNLEKAAKAWDKAAEMAYDKGELENAAKFSETAAKEWASIGKHEEAARAWAFAGKYDEAAREWEKAGNFEEAKKAWEKAAKEADKKGDHKKAEEFRKKAEEAGKKAAEAKKSLGWLLKEWGEAEPQSFLIAHPKQAIEGLPVEHFDFASSPGFIGTADAVYVARVTMRPAFEVTPDRKLIMYFGFDRKGTPRTQMEIIEHVPPTGFGAIMDWGITLGIFLYSEKGAIEDSGYEGIQEVRVVLDTGELKSNQVGQDAYKFDIPEGATVLRRIEVDYKWLENNLTLVFTPKISGEETETATNL